jgi:Gluconate 2-dehydrogenase subunit 3
VKLRRPAAKLRRLAATPLPGSGQTPRGGPDRFPGFDVFAEQPRWDPATAAVLADRLGPPPGMRFFSPAEEAITTALVDLLLGQQDPDPHTVLGARNADRQGDRPRIPVTAMIDSRLAEAETDGWRYANMPEDGQAWRDTLRFLEEDAQDKHGRGFADLPGSDQAALIQVVQDTGSGDWHGLPASRVWSLWTRYACTAFYGHPWAWNEMGFPGPAYPRGYKNIGVGKLEPFEVRDAKPAQDPVREDG